MTIEIKLRVNLFENFMTNNGFCRDPDKKANQGPYTVAVTGTMSSLFEAKKTPDGFTLSTKPNADLSKQSSPVFVPVQITEAPNPPRTVTVKIDLTDDKLTDTTRDVNAIVSSGMFNNIYNSDKKYMYNMHVCTCVAFYLHSMK